jgi:hypothetical protein
MGTHEPHRRQPALLVAIAAILALLCAVAGLVALSHRVDFSLGSADGTGATRVSVPLLFFGAIEGTFLYASMTAMAVESAELRQRLSRLFWPIYAVKVTLALTVAFSAMQGFDLLAHGFRPHWRILYSPSLRVVQDVVLLSTFLALTWLHAALLRGRGWTRRRVGLLIAFMVSLTFVVSLIAVEIARTVH